MPEANFSVEKHTDWILIRLSGDLRADNVPEVFGPLYEEIGESRVVMVDLEGVEYIDSAGIAALVNLHKKISLKAGGRLSVCGAKEEVWNVFRTMKLDRIFPFHRDLRQAVQAEGLVDMELSQG